MYDVLAPTGVIRIAIAVGPTKSAVWTSIPEGGNSPEGVTVDLARRIGEICSLPVELVQLTSSAHIIETANDGIWDLSFTPVDDHRRAIVDFGPAFHVGESSYLVWTESPFVHADDLHKPGVKIIAVAGTATLRTAERKGNGATFIAVDELNKAVAAFAEGRGNAIALSRIALCDLEKRIPGTRITAGNFHEAETAIAVPKNRTEALEAAGRLMSIMKEDGTVARSFERHGMPDQVIPE
jgi:polar amino acid transport system substrate-binding protein